MSEYGGTAKIVIATLIIVVAILFNQAKITRIEAAVAVYQIQLLGKILYFCPEKPNNDVDCGRWLRETAFGSTVFVQPGSGQVAMSADQ